MAANARQLHATRLRVARRTRWVRFHQTCNGNPYEEHEHTHRREQDCAVIQIGQRTGYVGS